LDHAGHGIALSRLSGIAGSSLYLISITEAGMALRKDALKIPKRMADCLGLNAEDAQSFYALLYKILSHPVNKEAYV
jgi:hypothetical protein